MLGDGIYYGVSDIASVVLVVLPQGRKVGGWMPHI